MFVYILKVSSAIYMVIYTHNSATVATFNNIDAAFDYCKANSLYITEVKNYA